MVAKTEDFDVRAALSCVRHGVTTAVWQGGGSDERAEMLGSYVENLLWRVATGGDPRLLPTFDAWRNGEELEWQQGEERGAIYVQAPRQ